MISVRNAERGKILKKKLEELHDMCGTPYLDNAVTGQLKESGMKFNEQNCFSLSSNRGSSIELDSLPTIPRRGDGRPVNNRSMYPSL